VLNFKFRRLLRGWSQAELARRANLHPSTISRIETGYVRPYPVQVEKIAKALQIAKDDVMKEVETSDGPPAAG